MTNVENMFICLGEVDQCFISCPVKGTFVGFKRIAQNANDKER